MGVDPPTSSCGFSLAPLADASNVCDGWISLAVRRKCRVGVGGEAHPEDTGKKNQARNSGAGVNPAHQALPQLAPVPSPTGGRDGLESRNCRGPGSLVPAPVVPGRPGERRVPLLRGERLQGGGAGGHPHPQGKADGGARVSHRPPAGSECLPLSREVGDISAFDLEVSVFIPRDCPHLCAC